MRTALLIYIVSAAIAGCATVDSSQQASIGALPDAPLADSGSATEASTESDERRELEPRHTQLPKSQLDLWNDPAFERYFIQSYIAETEVEPGLDKDEREAVTKIMKHMQEDRPDRALDLINRNNNPAASAVFDLLLGNLYLQQDQLEQAVAAYTAATQKYPKFLRAWKNLSVCKVRAGDFIGATPALIKVIELGARDALSFGMLGLAHAAAENNMAAETAFRMAVLLDPDRLEWKMNLARSLFKQEQYDAVAAMLNELITQYPERAELWLLQANAFIGLEKPMRAVENYEMVEQLGASTPESLLMLGDIYVNEQIYQLAVKKYMRALQMDPKLGLQRVVRASRVLAARGAIDETATLIDYIEQNFGSDLDMTDRTALLKLRSRIAVATGGGGEAEVEILKQIVAIDPLDGDALLLIGEYYRKAGEYDQAMLYLQQAESIEQFEADAKVGQAQVLVAQGRSAEALPLLRQAQSIKPRESVQDYLEQVERAARNR